MQDNIDIDILGAVFARIANKLEVIRMEESLRSCVGRYQKTVAAEKQKYTYKEQNSASRELENSDLC